MRPRIKQLLARLPWRFHFWSLSLAEKCRLMFGAAVFFSLTLVLLILYSWMRQLTLKDLIDVSKERVHTLYHSHFQSQVPLQTDLPSLDPTGVRIDANDLPVRWIRFTRNMDADVQSIEEPYQEMVRTLLAKSVEDDTIRLDRQGGILQSHYVRLVRASEQCISCHHAEGSAGAFSLGEPVGAALVSYRDTEGEINTIIMVNRIGTLVAGLIGATGAIVAFYWITQRVILRPIRQLRALVNNVAEGNLDIRSTIVTGDEYEKLADAFNHMLDNLQAAQEQLSTANRQLDIKIVELSERNIDLFKANKLKSEFLANISHEFRTPLNAILGFAHVIHENPASLGEEKGQRYAENIITSGNRLLNMINDLLQLAKAEAGKIELHIEQASISQVCEVLVSSFSLLTKDKHIQVEVDIHEDIPLLHTDVGKVHQILYNLFSNAVKFTPERGRIELKAHMLDDRMLRIEVTDNGPGIAPADQKKIFEKFRQIDGSITRHSTGTGLGLAICKELATMLAGHVGLESELNKGSTFWVEIPVILSKEEQDKEKKA
jgi:signal transduction histidine kinase